MHGSKTNFFTRSGSFLRATAVSRRAFRPEFPNRFRHPKFFAIRSATLDCLANPVELDKYRNRSTSLYIDLRSQQERQKTGALPGFPDARPREFISFPGPRRRYQERGPCVTPPGGHSPILLSAVEHARMRRINQRQLSAVSSLGQSPDVMGIFNGGFRANAT